ncbi:hypothetical protein DVH05_008272 [Phytophthora capsici]|nr:hypothetical protein DVH05_008272 [Phytophthora capsici]
MHAPRTQRFSCPILLSFLASSILILIPVSSRYFLRWDINAQIDRKKTKNVNWRNLSPKMELPDIPEHPEYSDLVEVLSVLHASLKNFVTFKRKHSSQQRKSLVTDYLSFLYGVHGKLLF